MRSFHARFTSTRRDVCKMESAKFAFCSRGRSEVLDYVTLFKLSLGSTLASSRYFFWLFKPFYLRSCVHLWGNAGELLSLTSHLLELKKLKKNIIWTRNESRWCLLAFNVKIARSKIHPTTRSISQKFCAGSCLLEWNAGKRGNSLPAPPVTASKSWFFATIWRI